MAKIIYGVAGEGLGHSSRSHLIGQHLVEAGHEVLFATSGKSLSHLRKHFGERVKEIGGLSLVCKDGTLVPSRTVATNLSKFLANRRMNLELYRTTFEPFQPDLVISDFEPFSAWWAWRNGVPLVGLDNQHLLTMCELEHPPGQRLSRFNAEIVTRCHYIGAAAYIVLSFFRAPLTNRRAVLAPPVIRPIVQSMKPTSGEHILIYTADRSWTSKLIPLLNAFHHLQFRVYGFDVARRTGNCEFKKTSTVEFLQDLASCRGVIATAGFSLLSECLHFRKKMLLLPIRGHYEQILNATYAQRLGVALHRTSLDAGTLAEYLDALDEPIPNHSDILWPDNRGFFDILHRTLNNAWSEYEIAPPAIPSAGGLATGI
jgi:uncharacterized protein (TIGR00661 family)